MTINKVARVFGFVMHTEGKYIYYFSNKLLKNYNSIVLSNKKINLMLPIILAIVVILGPLAMGNDVFATLTPPNAPNTGGGPNTANQNATATITSSPATGTQSPQL